MYSVCVKKRKKKKKKHLNAGRWRAAGPNVTADAKTLVGGVGARRTVDGALW
jgi:hypothetical protein